VTLVKRAGIFLIIVAFAVVLAGCELGLQPGFTVQYTVRISSAIGGTVTTPGEGLFRYPAGAVVNLVAKVERGYEFGSWVSNAHTIADVHSATTTITLDKNYYFVIANFSD
jgi:hypothetical protein